MFLVAAGGFLGGYDDNTLKSLVGMAKQHDIELVLGETNDGGGSIAKLPIGAGEQHSYDGGVETPTGARSLRSSASLTSLSAGWTSID